MYNIYFKNERINKKPLAYSEIRNILSYNTIYKKVNDKSTIEIPTRRIRVVRCITI